MAKLFETGQIIPFNPRFGDTLILNAINSEITGFKQRQAFCEDRRALDTTSLIDVDEAGIDDNEDYAWGWRPKGQRCVAIKPGHRQERIRFIAALHQGHLMAPMVFNGHCDTTVFTAWLERFLVPVLKPGQTVILDNARFHQGPAVSQRLAKAYYTLRYLPPYSPDLYPIEHYWAPLKNRIRKNIPTAPSFLDAVCDAFSQ